MGDIPALTFRHVSLSHRVHGGHPRRCWPPRFVETLILAHFDGQLSGEGGVDYVNLVSGNNFLLIFSMGVPWVLCTFLILLLPQAPVGFWGRDSVHD